MAVNYRHGDVVVLLDRVARTALLSSEDFAAQAAGHLKQLIFMSKILIVLDDCVTIKSLSF